ncbi:MAG: 3D domain-containing protein [Phycisphaeraceae bacterium]
MRRTLKRAAVGDRRLAPSGSTLLSPGGLLLLAGPVLGAGMLLLVWGYGTLAAIAEPMGLMAIESREATPEPEPAAPQPVAAEVTPAPVVEAEPAPAREPQPVAEVEAASPSQTGPTFDGRPLRPVRRMIMTVTAYSPDEQSCGEWADGWTASGYSVWTNGMKLVAADTSMLPFGTLVSIPGYNNGQPVQVLDRGGAIKGNRLDVLYPTHDRALQWGRQRLEITVWEYAD